MDRMLPRKKILRTNIFSGTLLTINGGLENELANSKKFDVVEKRSGTDIAFINVRRKV